MEKNFTLAKNSYILKKYNCMFEDILKKYQITQIEIDILAFLANHPEYKYAKDIVNVRGISKAHVSIAVEKLVQKGWMIRKCDIHNRRCNTLELTLKCSEIVDEILRIQKDYFHRLYMGLSQDEIAFYEEITQKMFMNVQGDIK